MVPETDALFFSKVAQAAQKEEGYHSSTAVSGYTKAKVFGMLKDILAKGKLRRYKANGTLVMYVCSDICLLYTSIWLSLISIAGKRTRMNRRIGTTIRSMRTSMDGFRTVT